MGKRNNLGRRDALKVLGCAACAVAVATPGCTFSELYEDFEGETVDVDLSEDKFIPLQTLDGMVAIDVGPVKLNLIRSTEVELVAIERICPHLQEDMAPVGSSPNARGAYSNGSLICTAHGSQFDLSGMPISGPSSVGLQRFPVDFRPQEQDGMATLYVGVEPPPGVI